MTDGSLESVADRNWTVAKYRGVDTTTRSLDRIVQMKTEFSRCALVTSLIAIFGVV